MAHVLIPTDFSNNALNAAIYAVHLYGDEGNSFTVVNSYNMPHGSAGNLLNINEFLAREANEGLSLFAERLKEELPDHDPDITVVCEQGLLPEVLARYEKDEVPPDLVVIGTQGAGAEHGFLMGSNTSAVIQHLRTPILAVPTEARYKAPRRIILADDGGPVEKQSLNVLLDIARWSKAEVMIVHVSKEPVQDEESLATSGFDVILGGIPHTNHTVSGENVMDTLNELADQSDTDMVVVLHRRRGMFDQLFHRSMSKRLATHTHIPLLVLQQGLS